MLSIELTVHKNTILKHYYCLEIRLYLISTLTFGNLKFGKKNIKIIKTIC